MNEMFTNEFMLNVAERVVSTRFNANEFGRTQFDALIHAL